MSVDHLIVGLTINYRDAMRTSRCIESLLHDGAHAVVVWDNSEDVCASATELDGNWRDDPRVVICVSSRNLGFAAGANRGISAIQQRWNQAWIMLINNDAEINTGALSELADALIRQPRAVIAFPAINHGGKGQGWTYYQRYFALNRRDRRMPGSFPYPSGAALLIAPQRPGYTTFDEDFFMYGEDVMLGWQLGSKRMAYVPNALVRHEGSASSRIGSIFYETHVVAAHWRLARKLSRSRLDQFVLLACRCTSLPVRATVRAFRSRSTIPLRALFVGWRMARSKLSR